MWIVAVAALHYAFEDFVMKWFIEVWLHFTVTADAKLRLTNLQHRQG
jgi:hypothetical protein